MDRIILQAQKDANKLSGRPKLTDTLTNKGFLRYLFYRNTMPLIRELSFLLITVTEFALVLYFFGKSVGVGSAIAGVFMFFSNNLWRAFLFSLRDKILELKALNKLNFIPKYFYSYSVLAIIYWLTSIIAASIFLNIQSTMGNQIFYHKLFAGIFMLISSTYFISAYTISRVYISLPYTILNRLLNLIFIVATFKYLGIYSFIISFYLTNIVDLFITIRYCKKIFIKNDISFKIKDQSKNMLDILLEMFKKIDSKNSIKRILTFVVIYIQPLLIIFLVNRYYPDYLIEFYVFSLLMNLLLLIPNRISKSMYYDLTYLIFHKNFSMLRNLFYKNLYAIVISGIIITTATYYIVNTLGVPQKLSWILLDLIMLDEWHWLYLFIFISFPLRLFSYLFMVSESFTSLILMTFVFDYALLAILFINSSQADNILYLFFVKGKISVAYLLTYILLFSFGIWKKDSKLNQISNKPVNDSLSSKEEYIKKVEQSYHLNPIICLMVLENKHTNTNSINSICKRMQERFKPSAITRISNNTLLILNNTDYQDPDIMKFEYVSYFGVFSVFISAYRLSNIKDELGNFEQKKDKLDTPNFIINQIYPTLNSRSNSVIPNFSLSNLEDLFASNNIKFKKIQINHETKNIEASLAKAKNKEGISRFCQILANNDGIVPDNLILKKGMNGIIPVIEHNQITKIYELQTTDQELIKTILRNILYINLYELCGGFWN